MGASSIANVVGLVEKLNYVALTIYGFLHRNRMKNENFIYCQTVKHLKCFYSLNCFAEWALFSTKKRAAPYMDGNLTSVGPVAPLLAERASERIGKSMNTSTKNNTINVPLRITINSHN